MTMVLETLAGFSLELSLLRYLQELEEEFLPKLLMLVLIWLEVKADIEDDQEIQLP